MGLLTDTYSDILKKLQGIQPADDPSGLSSDFDSSLGDGMKTSLREREGGSPLTQPGGNIFPTRFVPQNILNQDKTNKIPKQDATPSDPIVMGGSGTQYSNDNNFLSKLANLAGTDLDKAAATWKDKGGFEGLMSNPAFTIGLAFLQAGAEGKSLGAGALDNVIKAGAVSQQYKKIIESRKQAPIQATAADISETKNLLGKIGISEGNWFENFGAKVKNFFGAGGSKTPGLDYDKAVEEITVQYQAALVKKQKELKAAGKPTIIRIDDKIKIMEKLIKDGTIQKNSAWFKGLFTDDTLQKREHGGPVHEGKSYMVGEAGPEVFIPKQTGEVVANDDTQVFSMLLASNPQLQKVSKERAMKILKAKFPEYFD